MSTWPTRGGGSTSGGGTAGRKSVGVVSPTPTGGRHARCGRDRDRDRDRDFFTVSCRGARLLLGLQQTTGRVMRRSKHGKHGANCGPILHGNSVTHSLTVAHTCN